MKLTKAKKERAAKVLFSIWKIALGAMATIILLVGAAWACIKAYGYLAQKTLYETNDYHIVFMQDGLFYFCKLHDYNSEFIECKDPYYLVKKQVKDPTTGKNQEKVYVRRPSDEEVYKPAGSIFIEKNKVLYVARLSTESQVLQYIEKLSAK